jgi:dihydroneopterin aldolase
VTTGDVVELRGLQVSAFCGVLPEETERRQPIEIDLDVIIDLATAGTSDDLKDTVDYGALCEMIDRIAEQEHFSLLERFAARVAEVALTDPRVEGCVVGVRKLRPPVPQLLSTSGVRIARWRDGDPPAAAPVPAPPT